VLEVYGRDADVGRPAWLGSVKSNIGHTQTAAGVAGVIKMVMAMQNGILPQTLHADEPTAHVDWGASRIRLLSTAVEWPIADRTRRAGVTSLSGSGTIAHLILEEAPNVSPVGRATTSPRRHSPVAVIPVMLSGSTEGALLAQARRLHAHLLANPDIA